MVLKVAIIGAGPAGCLLARFLDQAGGVSVTLFEAELSLDTRSQGGTLDLHPRTGIAALKAAGLYGEATKLARANGARLKITDKKLQPYFILPAALHDSPEIDRVQLRTLLLEAIPPEMVRWGHRLESVDDGRTLHFTNGVVEKGYDLIVGADGAWSQVRKALSDQRLEYSGIAGYDTRITPVSADGSSSSRLVAGGSLFAFSDRRSIMGQQMGDGGIHVSLWSKRDEAWLHQDRQAIAPNALLDGYEEWDAQLRDMVLSCDGHVRTTGLYMLPTGWVWDHQPGITLMGDAAHLMTPFGGEGVNLALDDAKSLAQAILQVKSAETGEDVAASLDRNVARYEKTMLPAAHRAQKMSEHMMESMYFTEGAPRKSIESWLIARASYDMGPTAEAWTGPFLVAGVYSAYFWIKLFL